MTDYTDDRSAEALLARRAIAAQATPGPWWMDSAPCFVPLTYTVRCKAGNVAGLDGREDAAHIAATSPDVVAADIDEILRLRAEVQRLEKETHWLATAAANNGWHGVRVSPEWMREAARKAVEPENDRGWA